MSAQTISTPTHDQIAMRAYEIWRKAGCPEGKDVEHWQQAVRELSAKQSMPAIQPSMMMANSASKNRASRARAGAGV